MNKSKILSILLCAVITSTLAVPVMAVSDSLLADTQEVSEDYINPIHSQQVIDVTNDNVLPGKFRTSKDTVDE